MIPLERMPVSEVLSFVEPFTTARPEEIDALAKATVRFRKSGGSVLVAEGHIPDGLYVVLRGRVNLVRMGDGGRDLILSTLGPGDVFGESFPNYLRLFQALDAHSSYYLLPEVTQPTLVISGGLDWLTPASMSRRIARRIPGAEHLHLPRASHFALLEYSDQVLERMRQFLSPLKVHTGGSSAAA